MISGKPTLFAKQDAKQDEEMKPSSESVYPVYQAVKAENVYESEGGYSDDFCQRHIDTFPIPLKRVSQHAYDHEVKRGGGTGEVIATCAPGVLLIESKRGFHLELMHRQVDREPAQSALKRDTLYINQVNNQLVAYCSYQKMLSLRASIKKISLDSLNEDMAVGIKKALYSENDCLDAQQLQAIFDITKQSDCPPYQKTYTLQRWFYKLFLPTKESPDVEYEYGCTMQFVTLLKEENGASRP